MTTDTMDGDLNHLNSFPKREKEKVMRVITERPATGEHVYGGENCYENAVVKLRANGYRLIDLAPQDGAFTAVWYRKSSSWLVLRSCEYAVILAWETTDSGEQTTMRQWNL